MVSSHQQHPWFCPGDPEHNVLERPAADDGYGGPGSLTGRGFAVWCRAGCGWHGLDRTSPATVSTSRTAPWGRTWDSASSGPRPSRLRNNMRVIISWLTISGRRVSEPATALSARAER